MKLAYINQTKQLPIRSFQIFLLLLFILPNFGCEGNTPKTTESKVDTTILEKYGKEREQGLKQKESELLARNKASNSPWEENWKKFRKAYPYHIQVFALSKVSSDGSRTLIISEPPPDITIEKLLLTMDDLLLNHNIKDKRIGHDGWVKDVVVTLSGNDDDINSLLSRLSQEVFATSYKAYALPLPPKGVEGNSSKLDLQISTAELKKWLIDDKETFVSIEEPKPLALSELTTITDSTIYYSSTPGLVLWWLPNSSNIENCAAQSRQFALDSDLIIGGISNTSGIVIVGRQRIVPIEYLPPLRFETIKLIASVQNGQNGELQQSYERKYPFAGRLKENIDWAPIYLSPELVDTEYGSLLNITDQLLKGWSLSGDTHYENFDYKEPPPSAYPFKNPPLMERLNTTQLTFNWNTRGAGYTVDIGNYNIFGLYRTGALPVSYIPEGAKNENSETIVSAETEGYNFFGGLSDPNLVRVVQYAAVYQIFSVFNLPKPTTKAKSNDFPKRELERLTNSLADKITKSFATDKEALLGKLVLGISEQLFSKEALKKSVNEEVELEINKIISKDELQGIDTTSSSYQRNLSSQRAFLREILTAIVQNDFDKQKKSLREDVAYILEHPNGEKVNSNRYRSMKKMILSQIASIYNLPENYAKSIVANGWIHTPVVVISRNKDDYESVGGHNLGAKVSKFKSDSSVPKGFIDVDSEGNLRISPEDVGKASTLVRDAGRNRGPISRDFLDKLNRKIGTIKDLPPRNRNSALNLQSTSLKVATGGDGIPPRKPPRSSLDYESPSSSAGNGGNGGKPPDEFGWGGSSLVTAKSGEEGMPNFITVAKASNFYQIISGNQKFEVHNRADIPDVIVGITKRLPKTEKGVQLKLEGFAPKESYALLKTIEVRSNSEKIPREFQAIMGEENNGFILVEASKRKYDFSKAEIKESRFEEEKGNHKSVIVFTVPDEFNTAKHEVSVDVELSKETPPEIAKTFFQLIKESISNLFKSSEGKTDLKSFATRLRELIFNLAKKFNIEVNSFHQRVKTDKGDLYIVERKSYRLLGNQRRTSYTM